MSSTRNPVGWFEIYVQDIDRARAFYEKTLQVTLTKLDSPVPGLELWAFPGVPEGGGSCGAIVKMDGKDSGDGGTIIYFSCADCSVEGARAAASGGELEREKVPIGQYGFICYIRDTEGNRIGLHSMQ